MAIQPNEPRVRLSMEAIIVEAGSHGFQVSVIAIDPDQSGEPGVSALVARRLARLGITPTVLDGRRFAILNAQLINDATGLITRSDPELEQRRDRSRGEVIIPQV